MKRKHKLRDISIGIKVPALICLVLAFLVTGSSVFLYRYYYRMSAETVRNSMEGIIQTNARKASGLFDTIFEAIHVVNDNETAYQIPAASKLSNIADQIVNYKPQEDQSNLYENIKLLERNQDTFYDLFQVASAEENLSVSLLVPEEYPVTHLLTGWQGFEKENTEIVKSGNAEQEDWYRKALEAGGENYWFQQEEYPDRIFLAKQLNYQSLDFRNEYAVRSLGVIVANISMQWLDSCIQTADLAYGTQICLSTGNGNILYTAGEPVFSSGIISEYIENEAQNSPYKEFGGIQYLTEKSDIGHGLYLLTAIPVYDMEKMAFQMTRMILIVMLVVLLFGVFLMTVLSRWMLRPVRKLSREMEKGVVEEVDASFLGKDEIGGLFRSYNRMQEKIRELIKKVWEQAEKQKNAEIHALQMQINPHFVFNTLSAVGGLALLNGEDQIAEQLKLLSDLMRYNTRNPDGLVPLQTEISMIQKYEEIQRLSFDSCFKFYYQIEAECEKILIPKLIIQPLVENAILHSRDQRGEGSVTIRARLEEKETLFISVEDDGTGVDTDQINRYIRGENVFETDKESFGIRNVYDRIHLIYGENGELEYRHAPEGNTEAVITVRVG